MPCPNSSSEVPLPVKPNVGGDSRKIGAKRAATADVNKDWMPVKQSDVLKSVHHHNVGADPLHPAGKREHRDFGSRPLQGSSVDTDRADDDVKEMCFISEVVPCNRGKEECDTYECSKVSSGALMNCVCVDNKTA